MPALPPPITSRTNARVKALRAALSGEARKPGDLLGLEGEHLIQEAFEAGLTFEAVFVREGSEALVETREDSWLDRLRTRSWAVLSPEVFDSAVSTVTPQSLVATWIIEQPACEADEPNVLVLEGLQDPGNLGTLIRSALAFGFQKVLVTPETVNQWNPKAVRAAAGAIFRVPVDRKPLREGMGELKRTNTRSFAAVVGFMNGQKAGFIYSAPHGVLFGHRNNFEAKSPRYNYGEEANARERVLGAAWFPATLSHDADFTFPCAVLIGNEGAGLSAEARELADEQVQIPCHAESLNAAVAGSVLMYEAMRQVPLRAWARKQGLRP